jgi:ABC-type antimicrobial peptide transport system permease subunit
VAVSEIGSGLAVAGPDILFPRIVAGFSSSLGTMAFILELAGLYGVLSHVVAGRTREIGVRMALGASATRIQRMVVREGLSPVLFGLGIGLGLGILARTAMRPVFVRFIPSTDVSLLMLVPAFFVAAGLVACYSPARRASRVDPNVALRSL